MNRNGALAGMLTGAATVLFCIYVPVIDGLPLSSFIYEIIPGFIVCTLAVIIGSLATAEPEQNIRSTFEEMEREMLK